MHTASRQQQTIAREAGVRGVGFLSGSDVSLRFHPAAAGTGIVFVRADLPDRPRIPAHIRNVVPRQRRTSIQRGEATVEMIEHVMAALAGLNIDNCEVELDAPDTPGCDGSSQPFVAALRQAGIVEQDVPRKRTAIDRPITVREGTASLTAHPGDGERLVLTYNLDYGLESPIGRQSFFLEISPDSFERDLAPSRTFLLEAEAQAFLEAGMGARITPSDLLVFGAEGPIGNVLRFPDECVRHKILDMVGDLALLDRDLVGHVVAHRSGHQLNAALVRRLGEAIDQPNTAVDGAEPAHVLDVGAIMRILPHRYPFLLIDRVLELDPGKRVLALKNVTCNEPFFPGHWPDRPIMPGVLILEALAQTAGILIAHYNDPATMEGLIVSLDDVRIRRPVVPGDQLHLDVQMLRTRSRIIDLQGAARVDGQLAAESKMRFVVVARERAA